MIKMSKKLTNVLCIEGDSKKIEEFIGDVKEKGIKIVYARYPKNFVSKEDITKFINSKWRVANLDNLKQKVVFARKNSKTAYISFADDYLQHDLINFVQKLGLDAKYKYCLKDKNRAIVVTETYVNGEQLEADICSDKFKAEDYSAAICLS